MVSIQKFIDQKLKREMATDAEHEIQSRMKRKKKLALEWRKLKNGKNNICEKWNGNLLT